VTDPDSRNHAERTGPVHPRYHHMMILLDVGSQLLSSASVQGTRAVSSTLLWVLRSTETQGTTDTTLVSDEGVYFLLVLRG
jgi:hypothetical protein